jgi:NitT/TauT family transport system ATP-binding protein
MTAAVIEARGLDLVFQTGDGPVHALRDVSLSIARGDFVSFIGPSGCGKTTFLRVAAGLEAPTGGSISVNGVSPEAAREARAYGFVFQSAGLFPWRTIAGNVRLPLEIMGYSRAQKAERVARVLEMVELAGFAQKYPWQLSGGMQQRASIARALAFDADLLLMDEPFGALDEMTRDHLNLQLLDIWRETGVTILFVTHSIPEAVFLGQKVLMLKAHPGRMKTVVDIDLPYPREIKLRDTAEFTAYSARLRELLETC